MPIELLNTDEVVGTITATDENGNPVTLDAGSVTASVEDSSTLTATVSPDGSTVTVAAVGPLTTSSNLLTVTGEVNGVTVANPFTQLFDVVAASTSPVTIDVTFAAETPEAGSPAPAAASLGGPVADDNPAHTLT